MLKRCSRRALPGVRADKVAIPVLLCTIFCLSALFFPVDGDNAGTDPDGQLFSSVVDMDGFIERNNLAATMFLAASALLYVVSAELPKVSYLTTMDTFVVINLLLQFLVAIISWISTSIFSTISNDTAATINLVFFIVFVVALVLSTVWLLVLPTVREHQAKRDNPWPDSLAREVPEIVYYKLQNFVNVFPPWQPGTKNPIALPPKTFDGKDDSMTA